MFNDAFAPATGRPQDILVAALKHLGGVGHLREISNQCKAIGQPLPDPSIRRLFQQFSSDAVWTRSVKPTNAVDLFYSVDGVNKSTGFWGLRGFAVENPAAYPIPGFKRAYPTLLDRSETTLFNVRGIAYREKQVVGIQVGFSPDSPYPDKLLPDGRIEHIGEGRGDAQTATGGNEGMLRAIDTGDPIPVFQSVGLKGKKRYAELGAYRVIGFEKRKLALEVGALTDAYAFTLEPVTAISQNTTGINTNQESLGRGGFEAVFLREITQSPPQASGKVPITGDPEMRRQALERRSLAHHNLLMAFKKRADQAKLTCGCTQYADALCDGDIFEMKSLDDDEIVQVRAAIGQLYHYMFIHRDLEGYDSPNLYAVFDKEIEADLRSFVVQKARIGVIWLEKDSFSADEATKQALPWLFPIE